ncbi:hypothetical protein ABT126_40725 [Streptomyces sp. NPDC002012]|uniref:hypothetical protein n=1 Tax=Streptomyces sp. NPDC002012 TaxID=3154532 RepID=UPI00331D15D4
MTAVDEATVHAVMTVLEQRVQRSNADTRVRLGFQRQDRERLPRLHRVPGDRSRVSHRPVTANQTPEALLQSCWRLERHRGAGGENLLTPGSVGCRAPCPRVVLRDVKRRFLAYSSPSRLPDPPHLAVLDTSRLCQGRSRPPRHHPDQAALSFNPPAATGGWCRSPTSTRTNSASRRNQDLCQNPKLMKIRGVLGRTTASELFNKRCRKT